MTNLANGPIIFTYYAESELLRSTGQYRREEYLIKEARNKNINPKKFNTYYTCCLMKIIQTFLSWVSLIAVRTSGGKTYMVLCGSVIKIRL